MLNNISKLFHPNISEEVISLINQFYNNYEDSIKVNNQIISIDKFYRELLKQRGSRKFLKRKELKDLLGILQNNNTQETSSPHHQIGGLKTFKKTCSRFGLKLGNKPKNHTTDQPLTNQSVIKHTEDTSQQVYKRLTWSNLTTKLNNQNKLTILQPSPSPRVKPKSALTSPMRKITTTDPTSPASSHDADPDQPGSQEIPPQSSEEDR